MPSKQEVLDTLGTVNDPEIAVNIVDLGLVYDIAISEAKQEVAIKLTLTTPACPLLDELLEEISTKLKALPGVKNVKIDLVWEPPWTPDMMSEAAKIALGVV